MRSDRLMPEKSPEAPVSKQKLKAEPIVLKLKLCMQPTGVFTRFAQNQAFVSLLFYL